MFYQYNIISINPNKKYDHKISNCIYDKYLLEYFDLYMLHWTKIHQAYSITLKLINRRRNLFINVLFNNTFVNQFFNVKPRLLKNKSSVQAKAITSFIITITHLVKDEHSNVTFYIYKYNFNNIKFIKQVLALLFMQTKVIFYMRKLILLNYVQHGYLTPKKYARRKRKLARKSKI